MLLSPQRLLRSSCHPQSGRRWGRPPHRRVARPFRVAYRSGLPWWCQGRRGTFTGQCGQPLCPGETTSHPDGPQRPTVPRAAERIRGISPMLPQAWELGTPSRPKRDPSRTILAWPLRHRPLPDDAGCVPLRGEFEQGFPHGYGPARVGLDRSVWDRSHRLRLSQPHLRLTPSPKRQRRKPTSLPHTSLKRQRRTTRSFGSTQA